MSAWERQKLSALQNRADYEYTIGPGYYDIPGDVVLQGLPGDDLRLTNPMAGYADRRPNLPRDPQELYRPHRDRSHDEFIMWSEQEVAIGNAPIFVKTLVENVGSLAVLRQPRLPVGIDMPGGARVTELPDSALQRNANIPGTGIVGPSLPGVKAPQGYLSNYQLPVNFSIPRK